MSSKNIVLLVRNLPWTVSATELQQYFAQFGHIVRANVVFDKTTGFSKSYGFVTFQSKKAVDNVLSKPSHLLEGKALSIDSHSKGLQTKSLTAEISVEDNGNDM